MARYLAVTEILHTQNEKFRPQVMQRKLRANGKIWRKQNENSDVTRVRINLPMVKVTSRLTRIVQRTMEMN